MDDLSIFNKLFTQNNFSYLLKNKNTAIYNNITNEFSLQSHLNENSLVISEIYKFMAKNYRNEYFYQNTLFNKLLLGRHSLNTTTAISQLPIEKSIADFILINGKAVVYEIKTELDSFERLNSQLQNYYKAFNYATVVTCEKNYEKLKRILNDTSVGIYVLSDKNTLQLKIPPIENNNYLDYETIFNILRKNEFENIILKYFNNLPKTTQAFYYETCLEQLKTIPMKQYYKMFLQQIKKRNQIDKDNLMNIPYELKSLVYFSSEKNIDYNKLTQFLKEKSGG